MRRPGSRGSSTWRGGCSTRPARPQPPRIDDDDELRDLLNPAIDRVTRLVSLARSLADGTLPEESAGEAARAIAATQPARRPR